jgi:hypothetical protein
MGGTCERMPLDYASYQIGTGCVEQAIDWHRDAGTREGSTLVRNAWFPLVNRPPISSYLLLAERSTSLNRELETLTVSATLGVNVDDGSRVGGSEGNHMDPFCRLVTKQRRLSKECDSCFAYLKHAWRHGGLEMAVDMPRHRTREDRDNSGRVETWEQ